MSATPGPRPGTEGLTSPLPRQAASAAPATPPHPAGEPPTPAAATPVQHPSASHSPVRMQGATHTPSLLGAASPPLHTPSGAAPPPTPAPAPTPPACLPSNALLRRHLIAAGVDWLAALRARRRATTRGVSSANSITSFVEAVLDRRVAVLLGASSAAVLSAACIWLAWYTMAALLGGVAALGVVIFHASSGDARKVSELTDTILRSVEEAEALNHALLDRVSHRMHLHVVAHRLLLEAVTVCETGITYYPPSAANVAGEVTSNLLATTSARVHSGVPAGSPLRSVGLGAAAYSPIPAPLGGAVRVGGLSSSPPLRSGGGGGGGALPGGAGLRDHAFQSPYRGGLSEMSRRTGSPHHHHRITTVTSGVTVRRR